MVRSPDSQLYFVSYKDANGQPEMEFALLPSLSEARSQQRQGETSQPNHDDKVDNDSAFFKLMKESRRELEVFKSLEVVMGYLLASSPLFQFMFTIEPTLKKVAQLAEENADRRIYTYDRANSGAILRCLRQATNGLNGASQFPRLALIGLVSAYDVILQKLIRAGLQYEDRLGSGLDRSIKLKDLRSFSTIQEAADFLLEREIDSILQQDHLEQIKEVGKLFSINIDTDNRCVRSFLEICERRNLYTHNAGIVNQRYLAKCKGFGIDTGSTKLGTELPAPPEYYNEAVSIVDELCIKLIQFAWRKLVPGEREEADKALNEDAYRLIVGEEYVLAERILDYGINHTGKGKDEHYRRMVVNYANAIKLGGDPARALNELTKLDWSASDITFRISVAAVKDDLPQVLKLMPSAAKSGEMSASSYREWPVFRPLRGKIEFQEKFKAIYGDELAKVPPPGDPVAAAKESGSVAPIANTKGRGRKPLKLVKTDSSGRLPPTE